MSIKPTTGRRNYAKGKGYLAGGTIWPDPTSAFQEGLPISGGSANLPGGYQQTGGAGVYDPAHPEKGAIGWSEYYEPAKGSMGGDLGTTSFATGPNVPERNMLSGVGVGNASGAGAGGGYRKESYAVGDENYD